MEKIIDEMTEIYEKNKKDNKNIIIKKTENEESKDKKSKRKNSKDSYKSKEEEKIKITDKVYFIPNKLMTSVPEKKKKESFNENLYKDLNENELINFINDKAIPQNYLSIFIKYIFSIKDKNIKSILKTFLIKYKKILTEKHLFQILSKINAGNKKTDYQEAINVIVNNIYVDKDYFLKLYNDDTDITYNSKLIKCLNDSLNKDIDKNENIISWTSLIKILNLTSLYKLIITQEEYDLYENKIKEIEKINLEAKDKKCLNIDLLENNKLIDIDLIHNVKLFKSNPNQDYYIEEKIII